MILLSLLLLCTPVARAFHSVEEFLSRQRVLVRLDDGHDWKKNDRVLVLAREDLQLVALGTVRSVRAGAPTMAVVDLVETMGNHQVLAGDVVEASTAELLAKHHVPGYFSLLLADDRGVPARFRELAYMGVFNAEGHTLARKEWLVALTGLQYGVGERTTLKTQTSLLLDGFPNLGFKRRIMRNRYGHLTLNGMAARQVTVNDWVTFAGLVMTFPSNDKFQSHLVVNAAIDGIEEDNPEVKKLNLFPSSDIRTIYEYVTDDWDRVLFGPLFDFETRTVGGTVSQMWIWDTFHFNLGMGTKDVRRLEFKSDAYYVLFDFFWRF